LILEEKKSPAKIGRESPEEKAEIRGKGK